MRKTKRDKKGRYSDRKLLSKEKHERDYVRRVARSWLKKIENNDHDYHDKLNIQAGQLRRLCEFITG